MPWQGGFSDFMSLMLNSFSFFAPHYGANVAAIMWLITIMVVYDFVLVLKGNTEMAAKLSKLTLKVGAFGALYGVLMAVYDAGNPEIPNEFKKFELLARSANSATTIIYALTGNIVIQLIEFLKPGKPAPHTI